MKRFLFLIVLAVLPMPLRAQQRIFLFPEFVDGQIVFINQSRADVRLNIDTFNQVILFYDGETLMELTNPEMIRVLKAGERSFVMKEGLLCEVIGRDSGPVFVNWKLKKVNVGSKGALGATTQAKVEVVNARANDVQEIWVQKNENTYFFSVGDKECRNIRRLKDLYKAFPERAGQLKEYARKNKLTMTSADDAFRMIDYLRSLYAE